MVRHAQDWRWASLWVRLHGDVQEKSVLSPWPLEYPRDWTRWVNEPLHDDELAAVKTSLERGRPLGKPAWIEKTAARLDLGHTLRREGRPRKERKRN